MEQNIEHTDAVIVRDSIAVMHAKATECSPYAAAMRAVADPACDPVRLQALLAVRRDWMADEAKAAFNAAVVRFQHECPIIEKKDKAYDKLYARIDRIWRTIRPLMEQCGLAIVWEGFREQGGVCFLDGNLMHRAGHSQPLHHEVPLPDQIKGMNATQRSGAAETYAKRYAMCSALGIQTGDDDDGHGGAKSLIDDAEATRIRMMLKEAGRTEAWLCDLADVNTVADIATQNVGMVHKLIKRVIDANNAKGAK